MWLHVELVNVAALELYQKCGYRVVHRDRCWRPPFRRRLLMCKDLSPIQRSRAAPREGGAQVLQTTIDDEAQVPAAERSPSSGQHVPVAPVGTHDIEGEKDLPDRLPTPLLHRHAMEGDWR